MSRFNYRAAEPRDAYRVSVALDPVDPRGEAVVLSGVARATSEISHQDEDTWMVGFGDASPYRVAGPATGRLVLDWIAQPDGGLFRSERRSAAYPPVPVRPSAARDGAAYAGPLDGLSANHSALRG